MSESSGNSGPGALTIIVFVALGLLLYDGCQTPKDFYISEMHMSQEEGVAKEARRHENVGCPVLAKEQPDAEKIRKATFDDGEHRKCSLCSDGPR